MNRLDELQRALQAHVVDGTLSITAAIDSSQEIPAATRLKIYSDAYRLRLIDALQANYSTLAHLVGSDVFARMAQEYLSIYPSQHYSIRWFGHRLSQFLREFPDYREQSWLADLASWEWGIAAAFDAADAEVLNEMHLATIAPHEWADLRFALHPSAQRIALESNIVAIVKANDRAAPLPEPAKQERTEWLIWRQDLVVQYRSLDAVEAHAIDTVTKGATFGEMCAVIAANSDSDEQVPLVAAGYLKQWLVNQCLIQYDSTRPCRAR